MTAAFNSSRVGVLFGGLSSEREVSLRSGVAVYEALERRGVQARLVDTGKENWHEQITDIDRAMVMLHGRGGEDGSIQGYLDTIGIPYTGSGVAACALAMDKIRSKIVFEHSSIPTPSFCVVRSVNDLSDFMIGKDYPVIIKPSREGSTIGITKVSFEEELETAFEHALRYDSDVLVEHFVEGDELTVAILDEIALPVVRIVAPNNNYDYEAKYNSNDTQYFCPSELGESVDVKVQEMAMRAFRSLDCSGWGRVDILLDKNRRPWVLEVNTVPGMTDHSLVPLAARAAGLSFDELVLKILLTTNVA